MVLLNGILDFKLSYATGLLSSILRPSLVFWVAQQAGIQKALAKEKLQPKHNTNTPLFAALVGQVHDYALRKLFRSLFNIMPRTMGLPCFPYNI